MTGPERRDDIAQLGNRTRAAEVSRSVFRGARARTGRHCQPTNNCVGPVDSTKLTAARREVELHGVRAHTQALGNRSVRVAELSQLKHLDLALRQRGTARRSVVSMRQRLRHRSRC